MNFRTDLALERCEFLGKTTIAGVEIDSFRANKAKVTRIEVLDDEGASAVGKPVGRYVTVEVSHLQSTHSLLMKAFLP